MKSIVYWSPIIYGFLMRLGYGSAYTHRYEAIRDLVEPGKSLVDVCCGDCRIASYLAPKNIAYTGIDFSPVFLRAGQRKGLRTAFCDVNRDEIPPGDYVLMQASLYQFYPHHRKIIDKLLRAASRFVLISEPVINKAQSRNPLIAFLGEYLSDPGDGVKKFKFNSASLSDALAPYADRIVHRGTIRKGIEQIYVLRGDNVR